MLSLGTGHNFMKTLTGGKNNMAKKAGKVVPMNGTITFKSTPDPTVEVGKPENGLATIQQEYNPRLTQALTYKTNSQEDYNKGADLCRVFNEVTKKASAEKNKVLEPAKLTVKRINEQWKPFEDGLLAAMYHVKNQMLLWLSKEQEREEQQRRKILSDQRLKPETVEKKLATISAAPTSNTRSTLTLEITDINKIPRHYLMVDEVKLKAALKEGIKIEGAKLVNTKIIVTR